MSPGRTRTVVQGPPWKIAKPVRSSPSLQLERLGLLHRTSVGLPAKGIQFGTPLSLGFCKDPADVFALSVVLQTLLHLLGVRLVRGGLRHRGVPQRAQHAQCSHRSCPPRHIVTTFPLSLVRKSGLFSFPRQLVKPARRAASRPGGDYLPRPTNVEAFIVPHKLRPAKIHIHSIIS